MRIRIKRGLQAAVNNLVLAEGEMAVALDTGNVYIGTTTGTMHINPLVGTVDKAISLKNPRQFSIAGDGTANAVNFDGTENVILNFALKTMTGLNPGMYSKVTVDNKGRVIGGAVLTVEDIPSLPASKITDLPAMPTNVSQLANDTGYQTAAQVANAVSTLVGAAPETLNTLKELAAALGDDPNFVTTITNQLAGKEPLIKNAVEKISIVDNDAIPLSDSAGAFASKKFKFSLLKSTLKTYFDTLYNKYVHPSYSSKDSGLYKVTVDNFGHTSVATPVAKGDITALGIPAQDTVYSLPTASASILGGVKVGSGFNIANGVLSLTEEIDGGTF